MPSSVGNFFGAGQTIKGWCHTGIQVVTNHQQRMTQFNFINGFNLTFDDAKFYDQITAVGGITDLRGRHVGAIPFKFVTPLQNDRYKVFVQPVATNGNGRYADSDLGSSNPRPLFAHCLFGNQYPKTKNGFWVRLGSHVLHRTDNFWYNTIGETTSAGIGEVLNRVLPIDSGIQLQVLVL